jgi:hypothetical protein
MAGGIDSVNDTSSDFPVVLEAERVSVSKVPDRPLRVQLRVIASPSL